MTVSFDAASGVLRLSGDAFEQLVGLEPDGPVPADLRAAGVADDDGLHPLVAPLVQAVRRPLCMLRLLVRTPAGAELHQMWLTPGVTAALLPTGDGAQLLGLDTAFVPAAVARTVELRPRKRVAGQAFPVPAALVEALLDGQVGAEALGDHAPAEWSGCTSAWSRGDWRSWTCEVVWPELDADREPAGRSITVLDSGGGVALVEPAGADLASVVASTPTQVWRRLVALLPDDEEAADATAVLLRELGAG